MLFVSSRSSGSPGAVLFSVGMSVVACSSTPEESVRTRVIVQRSPAPSPTPGPPLFVPEFEPEEGSGSPSPAATSTATAPGWGTTQQSPPAASTPLSPPISSPTPCGAATSAFDPGSACGVPLAVEIACTEHWQTGPKQSGVDTFGTSASSRTITLTLYRQGILTGPGSCHGAIQSSSQTVTYFTVGDGNSYFADASRGYSCESSGNYSLWGSCDVDGNEARCGLSDHFWGSHNRDSKARVFVTTSSTAIDVTFEGTIIVDESMAGDGIRTRSEIACVGKYALL